MLKPNTFCVALAAMLGAGLLAGCGSDDDDDDVSVQAGDVFAITAANRLISFSPANPSVFSSAVTISGVTGSIVGMDFRPANGLLYVLANEGGTGRLYTLNTASGAATLVSTLSAPSLPDPATCPGGYTALQGGAFGVDFNPLPDRLRVVSNTGQNLRINVDTGVTCTDTAINPSGNTVIASAYTNSFGGAGVTGATTLYGVELNANPDRIVIQPNPNAGTVADTAPAISLGVNASDAQFDIDGADGTALVALTVNGTAVLLRVNLAAGSPAFGAVTALGAIGSGEPLRGLAIPAPAAPVAFASTATNQLVRFSPLAPDSVTGIGPIAPLQAGEFVRGLDFRPATGDLYALGSSGRVYRINPQTGAVLQSTLLAAPVGTVTGCSGGFMGLNGALFGVDFNPVPDRLRVVSDAEQNLRINVDDGTTCSDGAINPAATLIASAYTNNFAGADATTLYGIDTGTSPDRLVIQNPPNSGTITAVGSGLGTGLDADDAAFDIVGGHNGLVLAALNLGGSSNLYRVNLTAGTATQIGTTPIGGTTAPLAVTGLAIRLGD
jgi:3D (Asp-Asp-Asp) domain-containing protein